MSGAVGVTKEGFVGLNVVIGEELARFVEAKVDSGEYASAQDVVEDALRLLASGDVADEAKLAALRSDWDEGGGSGGAGGVGRRESRAGTRASASSRRSRPRLVAKPAADAVAGPPHPPGPVRSARV